ncbi:DUF1289 domain-containing protein [Catenovulum maritimum]|uniref:Fe-S protein n=1 Tax=Catenovulum maritimum TaxID=1513271 RepID=A0A0J8GUP0_9ALTE|nr:DUF1289 domain-containing protein [Catenovulum maritimum]KMT64403.1 hypothetical protein XM47_14595 [Catenovulum maritimum]
MRSVKLKRHSDLSPCIRNCCLNEQDVCIGCGRMLSEITSWNKYTSEQQQAIIKLAHLRLVKSQNELD